MIQNLDKTVFLLSNKIFLQTYVNQVCDGVASTMISNKIHQIEFDLIFIADKHIQVFTNGLNISKSELNKEYQSIHDIITNVSKSLQMVTFDENQYKEFLEEVKDAVKNFYIL